MMSIHSIFSFCYWCLRPLWKWILRKTTKLCELQRICYGEVSGAPRTLAVESSLLQSHNPALRELPQLFEKRNGMPYRTALQHAIETVIINKKINPRVHVQFFKSFAKCLEQIWGYISLMNTIEELRKTQYDCHNMVHEEKLLKLWSLLVPDIKLDARVTKQWQFIGFQGDDPKTDFRGMGILGLENLLFFASEYTNIAQKILLRSQHPKYGYAFAIVGKHTFGAVIRSYLFGKIIDNIMTSAGINLTHLTYYLVKDGAAKTHLYNATRSPLSIRTFNQLYCYMYVEFDKFWSSSRPNTIMDFSFIRDKFEKNIRESLSKSNTVFRINVVIDEI